MYSQKIIRYFDAIKKYLVAIERDNYNVEMNYKLLERKDELGEMGNAIEKLAANTKSVITDLGVLLDEIAHGNLAVKTSNPQLYIGIFGEILTSINRFTETLNGTMLNIDTAAEPTDNHQVRGIKKKLQDTGKNNGNGVSD